MSVRLSVLSQCFLEKLTMNGFQRFMPHMKEGRILNVLLLKIVLVLPKPEVAAELMITSSAELNCSRFQFLPELVRAELSTSCL